MITWKNWKRVLKSLLVRLHQNTRDITDHMKTLGLIFLAIRKSSFLKYLFLSLKKDIKNFKQQQLTQRKN